MKNQKGILFGAGVGPGDSELMTLKSCRIIRENDGFQTELVSGVTSFSAAAARLKIPLAEWREPLFIIPALHHLDDESLLNLHGNFVLMKSGSKMAEVKEKLKNHGFDVKMAENVGMENEKIYQNLDEIPDDAGYFSLIIAKH